MDTEENHGSNLPASASGATSSTEIRVSPAQENTMEGVEQTSDSTTAENPTIHVRAPAASSRWLANVAISTEPRTPVH